jgi:mannose-6-phosphate isomerase-like protein (cupin superfamily)
MKAAGVMLIATLCAGCTRQPAAPVRHLGDGELQAAAAAVAGQRPSNRVLLDLADGTQVKIAVLERRCGPWELNRTQGRLFIVRAGNGVVGLDWTLLDPRPAGDGKLLADSASGGRQQPIAAGDVLSVPPGTSYRLDAGGSRLELLVITIPSP